MTTPRPPVLHHPRGAASTQTRAAYHAAPGGFYYSRPWRKLRKAALIRDGYRCRVCGTSLAGPGQARVDHIKPVRTHPHLALSLANLRSLCPNHDNKRHWEKGRPKGLGCDENGIPIDSRHHWQKEKNLPLGKMVSLEIPHD